VTRSLPHRRPVGCVRHLSRSRCGEGEHRGGVRRRLVGFAPFAGRRWLPVPERALGWSAFASRASFHAALKRWCSSTFQNSIVTKKSDPTDLSNFIKFSKIWQNSAKF
jgi:hypothetical protein